MHRNVALNSLFRFCITTVFVKSANGKVRAGVAMCDGNVRVHDLTSTSTVQDTNECVDECAEISVILATNNEDDVAKISDDADRPILVCQDSSSSLSSSNMNSCSDSEDSEPEDTNLDVIIVEVCSR